MSLAVKFGDSSDEGSISGVLYFSAVTKYERRKSGKLTEHPIDGIGDVSDHFISDNPVYEVEGVFSFVDFSLTPSLLLVDGEQPINVNIRPNEASISGGVIGGLLGSIIPDSVSQFFNSGYPSASVSSFEPMDYTREIEDFMYDLLRGLRWNKDENRWESKITLASIYEVDNNTAVNPIGDLVLVEFNVSEDAESGDGMFVTMKFEQPMFATLQEVDAVPPPTNTEAGRQLSSGKSKGNLPSEERAASAKNEQEHMTAMGEISKGLGL